MIARLTILVCLSLLVGGCKKEGNQIPALQTSVTICAILAHPDDETIISGTLAMLTDQGYKTTVVYVTSGDDGPDETGRGLRGIKLAEVREDEAKKALESIDKEISPVFLRFPDGHVQEFVDSIQQLLEVLLDELNPQIVIGFGPDGITGNSDHRYTGMITDSAFDRTECGRLLLHMAVTKPLPPYYAYGVAVPRNEVDLRINVSRYFDQRIKAVESHKTQFSQRTRSAYKVFVHTMRKEKYIIARNRDTEE